jgi:hypothetical protein
MSWQFLTASRTPQEIYVDEPGWRCSGFQDRSIEKYNLSKNGLALDKNCPQPLTQQTPLPFLHVEFWIQVELFILPIQWNMMKA